MNGGGGTGGWNNQKVQSEVGVKLHAQNIFVVYWLGTVTIPMVIFDDGVSIKRFLFPVFHNNNLVMRIYE